MTWSKIDTPLFSPNLFHPVLFAKQNAKPRVYLAPGCQVVMRKLSGYGNLQLPTPGSQRWITSTHNVANKTKYKSIRKGSIQKKTMMKTSSLWNIHPIKVREKNVFFFVQSSAPRFHPHCQWVPSRTPLHRQQYDAWVFWAPSIPKLVVEEIHFQVFIWLIWQVERKDNILCIYRHIQW